MNPRALVIEAQNGISGDMFVAAAAALADCEAEVLVLPEKLGLDDVRCRFSNVVRSSLQCRKFDVLQGGQLADTPETEATEHPHSHEHQHDHDKASGRHRPHESDNTEHHHHEHRSLTWIRAMIKQADLEAAVATRAIRMFECLGTVEAEAHGIPVEQVHFHEVGAVDSIVDIVAAALCIERLQMAKTYATPVCVGSGTVATAHGQLPVPAPATEKLLRGFPTVTGDRTGEWTTPTGALILRELQPLFSLPTLTTLHAAFGGGTKDPRGRPNVLRLRLAEETVAAAGALDRDELCALLANIDDTPGELLGAELLDTLLQAGARDAVIQPIVMKKGRPAHQLEVLAEPDDAARLAELILTHTSTIGVRMFPVQRFMLPRESVTVQTELGAVAAKRVTLPGGATRVQPEFEACRRIAAQHGIPVQEVYRQALGGRVR